MRASVPAGNDTFKEAQRLYEQGNYVSSLGRFLEVLRQDPKNAQAKDYIKKIGENLRERENRLEQTKQGRHSIILRILKDMMPPSPETQRLVYDLADRYREREEYIRAWHILELVASSSQRVDPSLYRRQEKIQSELEAMTLSRDRNARLYGQGAWAFTTNKFDEAEDRWTKLAKLGKASDEVMEFLNISRQTAREKIAAPKAIEVQKAEDAVEEIVFKKLEVIPQLYLGGDWATARQVLLEAKSLSPNNPDVLRWLNWIENLSSQLGAYPAARKESAAPVPTGGLPPSVSVYPKEEAAASAAPERKAPASKAAPSGADIDKSKELYNLGLIAYMEGLNDRALSLWEKALQLDPQNAKAQVALERLKGEQ